MAGKPDARSILVFVQRQASLFVETRTTSIAATVHHHLALLPRNVHDVLGIRVIR
jgi:hypothetical protein